MDVSSQIKNSLISRIKASKDINFLKAIQTIFDASDQSLFELTSEQEAAIELGRIQIKNGNAQTNEEVMLEMREWLSKK